MTKDEFYNRQRVLLYNYNRAKQELIAQYTGCTHGIGDNIDGYTIFSIDVIHYNDKPIAAYFCKNDKGERKTFLQNEIEDERS